MSSGAKRSRKEPADAGQPESAGRSARGSRRRGRVLKALVLGGGVVALVSAPEVRNRLLDALFGPEEQFEYDSVTEPLAPPIAPDREPAPARGNADEPFSQADRADQASQDFTSAAAGALGTQPPSNSAHTVAPAYESWSDGSPAAYEPPAADEPPPAVFDSSPEPLERPPDPATSPAAANEQALPVHESSGEPAEPPAAFDAPPARGYAAPAYESAPEPVSYAATPAFQSPGESLRPPAHDEAAASPPAFDLWSRRDGGSAAVAQNAAGLGAVSTLEPSESGSERQPAEPAVSISTPDAGEQAPDSSAASETQPEDGAEQPAIGEAESPRSGWWIPRRRRPEPLREPPST